MIAQIRESHLNAAKRKCLISYLQWQTKLDLLYERSKVLVPIRARSERQTQSRQVMVLTDYITPEVSDLGERVDEMFLY